MTTYFRHLIYGIAVLISLNASMNGQAIEAIAVPTVPVEIQVPTGNIPFLKTRANGTQNYICLPTSSGVAWTFLAPQATLFFNFSWITGSLSQQLTTHFLSANPKENGTPRATWQHSVDTSKVWGRVIASSADPNVVVEGAIPWLLVRAVGNERGPTGGGTLFPTTFIQRINTTGGVAPTTGCSESAHVGSTALVPYTADYFFFKARQW